jgi:Fe-Mn family superoxide dismutase
MIFSQEANQASHNFVLPTLPYSKDALLPHLSVENFDYHYGKHHNAYVVNLNKLIQDDHELANKSLEEVIVTAHFEPKFQAIFNNAAQIWNHSFYWHSMSPNSENRIINENLKLHIIKDFGSLEAFAQEFTSHGIGQFGSGWVWLVLDRVHNKLEILKTANAHTPICQPNLYPLITCDVWEHAYYIDYRNDRANYLSIFLQHLVNWNFALKNYLNFQHCNLV